MQLSSSPEHEESTIFVLGDDNDKAELARMAQKIWKHCFGVVRSSGEGVREPRQDRVRVGFKLTNTSKYLF